METSVFGNLFRAKRKVVARLDGIQRTHDYHLNLFLQNFESKLMTNYKGILRHEELHWYQKSRNQWLNWDDRNTRFYHLSTITRRKPNKIDGVNIGRRG